MTWLGGNRKRIGPVFLVVAAHVAQVVPGDTIAAAVASAAVYVAAVYVAVVLFHVAGHCFQ